jgi:Transposase IS66 family
MNTMDELAAVSAKNADTIFYKDATELAALIRTKQVSSREVIQAHLDRIVALNPTEVGCWMHARRYLSKALESDAPHMGPALHLIGRLYAVEERAKALSLSGEQRMALRQRVSVRLIGKLHQYLQELQPKVLPKSPSGAAVRYALNQWEALTRFLEDGELEIDNGATERANRDIALGRGNWTFFGSDSGGKTAAVCSEASSLPANGVASSRLPGSTTCSRASRRTPSPD